MRYPLALGIKVGRREVHSPLQSPASVHPLVKQHTYRVVLDIISNRIDFILSARPHFILHHALSALVLGLARYRCVEISKRVHGVLHLQARLSHFQGVVHNGRLAQSAQHSVRPFRRVATREIIDVKRNVKHREPARIRILPHVRHKLRSLEALAVLSLHIHHAVALQQMLSLGNTLCRRA